MPSLPLPLSTSSFSRAAFGRIVSEPAPIAASFPSRPRDVVARQRPDLVRVAGTANAVVAAGADDDRCRGGRRHRERRCSAGERDPTRRLHRILLPWASTRLSAGAVKFSWAASKDQARVLLERPRDRPGRRTRPGAARGEPRGRCRARRARRRPGGQPAHGSRSTGVREGRPLPAGVSRANADCCRWSSRTRSTGAASGPVHLSREGDLAAYEELRSGFTAAVSHELRTPLARLLALLETAALPGEDVPALVDQARAEVEQIRELIDEVLFLSELESGARVVSLSAVPVEPERHRGRRGARGSARAGRGERGRHVGDPRIELAVRPRMLRVLAHNLAGERDPLRGARRALHALGRAHRRRRRPGRAGRRRRRGGGGARPTVRALLPCRPDPGPRAAPGSASQSSSTWSRRRAAPSRLAAAAVEGWKFAARSPSDSFT